MNNSILKCFLLLCCCALSGCTGSDISSNDVSSREVQTASITTVTAEKQEVPKHQTITVITKQYDGENLLFEYNGEAYSLPFKKEYFIEEEKYPLIHTSDCISVMIINNKLGERVTGVLEVNEDITEAFSCDVVGNNGEPIDEFSDVTDKIDENELFKAERVNGSIYTLKSCKHTLSFDVNSLPSIYKGNIPEDIPISFAGYVFSDGWLISEPLATIDIDDYTDIKYSQITNQNKISFFGTIKSLSDDRAAVLLTDGKTLCDVPAYYTDGELKEGMEVMATLNAGPEFYGSGKEYKDDFAVFHTDPKEYNTSGCEFSELAFAKYDEVNIFDYIYTKADEIG